MVGLTAHFLGNQEGSNATLLPEIEFSKSTRQIEDFNPKSVKIRKTVGKLYNFKSEPNSQVNHSG